MAVQDVAGAWAVAEELAAGYVHAEGVCVKAWAVQEVEIFPLLAGSERGKNFCAGKFFPKNEYRAIIRASKIPKQERT